MCKINCSGGCPECDPDGHKPKPHKHADVIKAWADGALIEYHHPSWKQDEWEACGRGTLAPMWREDYRYRVKPEEKPLWQVARDGYYNSDVRGHMGAGTVVVWSRAAEAVVKAYKERTGL